MVIGESLPLFDHVTRVVRTVVFVDVVESVRLLQQDEEGAVRRWRSFVDHVVHRLLPEHEGRLVKSLGDGLMLEFPRVQSAVGAAFAMQESSARGNEGVPPEQRMLLRIGIHVSPLIADDLDLYGHGVNLAARLTTLAGPAEIVVSADVRDQLTPALDADIEDLGECYVKHLQQPVRAYRVGRPGDHPIIDAGLAALPDLHPTIAVIPFASRDDSSSNVLGQALADEMISFMSRSPDIHVVSRLSTSAFAGRDAKLDDISQLLHANYVLAGSYHVTGDTVVVSVELADARSKDAIWSKSLKGSVTAILAGKSDIVTTVAESAMAAMVTAEIRRAQSSPLPTLEAYTLLLGSIALMHRLSPQSFERAKGLLQALIERAPRLAAPYAWLAKWYVLRVQQGWSPDPQDDARRALDCTKHALENDATCSLAMAVEGFVHTNLLKRLDTGMSSYELAISVNPNDSLAWLLMGTLHAFRGEGKTAVRATQHALKLSPLDPQRYFYDSLAATAAFSAGQYERALKLAERSLKANRTHASTLRVQIISLWQLGRADEARRAASDLLRVDPAFTVTRFLQRSPAAEFEVGKLVASCLTSAGVPV